MLYNEKKVYLAGVFDSGLSVDVVKNKRSYRIRMCKTSSVSDVPALLYTLLGFGLIYQTKKGTRWAVEEQADVLKFLEMISPHVVARKTEVDILIKMLEGTKDIEEHYTNWRKVSGRV